MRGSSSTRSVLNIGYVIARSTATKQSIRRVSLRGLLRFARDDDISPAVIVSGAAQGKLLLAAAWIWVALVLAAYLAQFLPLLRPILALLGLA